MVWDRRLHCGLENDPPIFRSCVARGRRESKKKRKEETGNLDHANNKKETEIPSHQISKKKNGIKILREKVQVTMSELNVP